MNLKLIQEYCSIKELDEISLPDFVILTGKNGAGKTQLLKAIEQNDIMVTENTKVINNIAYVNFSENSIQDNSYTSDVDMVEEAIAIELIDYYKKNGEFSSSVSFQLEFSRRNLPSEVKENIKRITEDMGISVEKIDITTYKYWKTNFKSGVAPYEILKLSEILTRYYEVELKNDFKKYRKDSTALSQEEFEDLYGKDPLTLFNKYLKTLNDNFEIEYNKPNDFGLKRIASIKNKLTSDIIPFSNLSTGEKTFLRVLLIAFSNDMGLLKKPELVLLDEIDSGLHPTMMKEFLNYIKKLFVKELNVKLILTTHSPTTVALVNEESLYYMSQEEPRISKISKKTAISNLTSEIPFLSVNYECVKQVFVESEEDEKIYREIYDTLLTNGYIHNSIPLVFIGSGVNSTPNSGNCKSVKKFATELLKNGNSNVYGIIDYDNKNKYKDNIFIIGENKKYSIETCILDPVLIGMYLIREGHSQRYSLPFDTFTSLSGAAQQDFQCIADIVIDKLGFDNSQVVEIEYVNGYKIKVSKEMMEYNGHNLEQLYKDKFGELIPKKLKNEIVKKVINEYSKFCPIDFVEVFNRIINYDN